MLFEKEFGLEKIEKKRFYLQWRNLVGWVFNISIQRRDQNKMLRLKIKTCQAPSRHCRIHQVPSGSGYWKVETENNFFNLEALDKVKELVYEPSISRYGVDEGQELREALIRKVVMANDFFIAQFCFLERLLVVHGHWCYKRIAQMNIAFGLTLFYFEAFTGFSGQSIYDDWYMILFNVVLTSLPVISLGVFEQDVSSKEMLQFSYKIQQDKAEGIELDTIVF
ncbi:hypothetical protein REPUB_Repub04eG0139400 [Reevesia pubescens]